MSGCLAMSGREKLSAHLPRYREFFFLDPRDVCFLNNPTPTGTLRRLSCSDGHKYRRGFSSGNGVVQVAMTERWLLVVCGGRISPGRSRPPKWPGGIFPGRAQRTWQEAEGTAEEVFSVTWYPFRTIGGYILWTSAHGTKVQVSFLQSFCEEDCGLHWPTPILLACGNPTFFFVAAVHGIAIDLQTHSGCVFFEQSNTERCLRDSLCSELRSAQLRKDLGEVFGLQQVLASP